MAILNNEIVSINNNGDLNPDPFYLTVVEARKLADYLEDMQLKDEIRQSVWEGDTMIPIAQKYLRVWEELKDREGL